jgi:hypothetical protein
MPVAERTPAAESQAFTPGAIVGDYVLSRQAF